MRLKSPVVQSGAQLARKNAPRSRNAPHQISRDRTRHFTHVNVTWARDNANGRAPDAAACGTIPWACRDNVKQIFVCEDQIEGVWFHAFVRRIGVPDTFWTSPRRPQYEQLQLLASRYLPGYGFDFCFSTSFPYGQVLTHLQRNYRHLWSKAAASGAHRSPQIAAGSWVSLIRRFHGQSAAGWAGCEVAGPGPGRFRPHAAQFSEISPVPLILDRPCAGGPFWGAHLPHSD